MYVPDTKGARKSLEDSSRGATHFIYVFSGAFWLLWTVRLQQGEKMEAGRRDGRFLH